MTTQAYSTEPVGQHNLILKIKTGTDFTDYSPDLLSARIINSLATPYPIVVLDLFADPEDVASGKISPKSEISFRVDLVGDENTPEPVALQSTQYNLMLLKTNILVAPSEVVLDKSATQLKDRSPISLICLCKGAFKIVTSLVNTVFIDTTVPDILQSVIGNIPEVKRTVIDKTEINQERIDQFIVPPMPFYKFLQYLDFTFGIYDGIFQCHVNHENIVRISNLSKALNKEQAITIWQLSMNEDDKSKEIEESVTADGKVFYTYSPIGSENKNNSKFSNIATNLKHIVKPKDQLFYKIEQNLNDIATNFGVTYKTSELDVNSGVVRSKYKTAHSGFGTSQVFADAMTSKEIFNLTTTSIYIERNMNISTLIQVGIPIKLNTNSLQYADLSGKYILHSSDIGFFKKSSWNAVAKLNISRTSDKVGYRS